MSAPSQSSPHYRRIAEMLRLTLTSGALRAGDRMISARKLAEREHVSLPTALEALRCLEAEGLIVARPRSGYYIHQTSLPQPVEPSRSPPGPVPVTLSAMARSLFSSSEARLVPLGAALPEVQKPVWCLWVQPCPILRGCRARRYSGRCTPRADVWTRTVSAIACRR